VRVLVVDDHRAVLWGLGKLIESAGPPLELVGTASNSADALAASAGHRPNVVLLDLDLGTANGADLVPQMCQNGAKVIILSGSADPELRERAVMAGASGFVHKSEPAETILRAITRVHAGEVWLERATVARMFASFRQPGPRSTAEAAPEDALTPAERKVIVQVVRHKSAPNKVIADALGISAHTLRNHLASIYDKLSLNRRLDLVLYAVERKLDQAAHVA
jgi:two-component system, NarL family, nitrate/nitrite response regulator NarL